MLLKDKLRCLSIVVRVSSHALLIAAETVLTTVSFVTVGDMNITLCTYSYALLKISRRSIVRTSNQNLELRIVSHNGLKINKTKTEETPDKPIIAPK